MYRTKEQLMNPAKVGYKQSASNRTDENIQICNLNVNLFSGVHLFFLSK